MNHHLINHSIFLSRLSQQQKEIQLTYSQISCIMIQFAIQHYILGEARRLEQDLQIMICNSHS